MCAYLLASLMDVSTASAPVFIGSATSIPETLHSLFRNAPILSLWKALEVKVTRFIWSAAALTIFGCMCPWLIAEYELSMSMYFLPSTSHTQTPLAFDSTTGNGW